MEIKVIPHYENVDLLSLYDYNEHKKEEEEDKDQNLFCSETAPCTPGKIPTFTKCQYNFNDLIMK
jgi:hypothetical protein